MAIDSLNNLFVFGINFHKADLELRSRFSLDTEKQHEFYRLIDNQWVQAVTVLNTCNRCEVYGIGNIEHAEQVYCQATNQSQDVYQQHKFLKTGTEALQHIHKVVGALDSQILGDNEILGQFKAAIRLSKEYDLDKQYFEKVTASAIQAAREIRKQTELCKGTSSVAYAAVQIIRDSIFTYDTKALVIGTGKFGHGIIRNLRHYLPEINLTITNRTHQSALDTANEFSLKAIRLEEATADWKKFDLVLICANSTEYLINDYLGGKKHEILVLDLSVPRAANPNLADNSLVTVYNIDQISEQLNNTLKARHREIPRAEAIVNAHISDFIDWYVIHLRQPQIVLLRQMLAKLQLSINGSPTSEADEKLIATMTGRFIKQLKGGSYSGCSMIEIISDFIDLNKPILEKSF